MQGRPMRYMIVVLGLLALMHAPVLAAAGHAPSPGEAIAGDHLDDQDHTRAEGAAGRPYGTQAHDGADHDHPLAALPPPSATQTARPSAVRWRLADTPRRGGAGEGPRRPPRIVLA